MSGISVLAVAVVTLTGSMHAQEPQIDRIGQLRCDIAWAYIEGSLRAPAQGRSVFSTEPLNPFVPDDYPRHWGAPDGPGEAPPPPDGLVETVRGGTNAVRSCASIRRSLRSSGLRYGESAVASASQIGRGGYFRARIETVSLPTVGADGTHAILVASNSRGRTDAGEVWVHLELGRDGRWRVAGLSALFVS